MVPTPMYMASLPPGRLQGPLSRPDGPSIPMLPAYGSVPERAMRRNSRALGRARRASVSGS
jgi:hypothetical protein